MFTSRAKPEDERRPVSIIITTLAALAHERELDLETAIRGLIQCMPRYIEVHDGRWWVENPANRKENCADKWNEKPERREVFRRWLERLGRDIGGAGLAKSTSAGGQRMLRESFGMRDQAGGIMVKGVAVRKLPAETVPALADASDIQAPGWPERRTYRCRVRGWVYRSRKRRLWERSARPVPKHFDLRFEADTNVHSPYEVHWQVANTGTDAARAGGLRGECYDSEGRPGVRWESTAYASTHWVEAFVVKDGICVARSGREYVLIKCQLAWQELTDSASPGRLTSMKKSLTSMNISIPSALRERLEEKLSRQAYGSASEYVRQLIRQDLERDAREKVEALLLEGVHSNKRIKVTPKWWEEKEAMIGATPRRSAKRA